MSGQEGPSHLESLRSRRSADAVRTSFPCRLRRKGTGAVAVRWERVKDSRRRSPVSAASLARHSRPRTSGIHAAARPALTSGSRERLAVTDRSRNSPRGSAGRSICPEGRRYGRQDSDLRIPARPRGGGVAMFTFLDAPVFALYLAYAVRRPRCALAGNVVAVGVWLAVPIVGTVATGVMSDAATVTCSSRSAFRSRRGRRHAGAQRRARKRAGRSRARSVFGGGPGPGAAPSRPGGARLRRDGPRAGGWGGRSAPPFFSRMVCVSRRVGILRDPVRRSYGKQRCPLNLGAPSSCWTWTAR